MPLRSRARSWYCYATAALGRWGVDIYCVKNTPGPPLPRPTTDDADVMQYVRSSSNRTNTLHATPQHHKQAVRSASTPHVSSAELCIYSSSRPRRCRSCGRTNFHSRPQQQVTGTQHQTQRHNHQIVVRAKLLLQHDRQPFCCCCRCCINSCSGRLNSRAKATLATANKGEEGFNWPSCSLLFCAVLCWAAYAHAMIAIDSAVARANGLV